MGNYELLIKKLDQFIRKYYANKLMRGTLIGVACMLCYFLLITIGEYVFYFPVWLKVSAIMLLLAVGLWALIAWILRPLLSMQQLGKIISHEQAATIIGQHFPEVNDKLLNILQLQLHDNQSESRALIEASIQQKSKQIVVLPFGQAVDLKKNKKYLPYLLVPMLVMALILMIAPQIFREATARLMQPTKAFDPPAPFSFHIQNKSLRVPMNGQFVLNLEVKGEKIPQQVFLVMQGERIEMTALNKMHFQYTFSRVRQSIPFYFSAAGLQSSKYKLEIIEQPRLTGFSVGVHYPAYTGRASEQLQSLSDIQVPEGTELKWELSTENADYVQLRFGQANTGQHLTAAGKNQWTAAARFYRDTTYSFKVGHKKLQLADSLSYRVQVIKDQHPQVNTQLLSDSLSGQQILIVGSASDDYGLTQLYFHYTVSDQQKNQLSAHRIPKKRNSGKVVPFQQYFDFASLQLLPGQEVSYYVEAWDNDAVNGHKSGRSPIGIFKMPEKDQLQDILEQNAEQINQGLSTGASQSEKIQEEVKSLQNELLQSNQMTWEKQQGFKNLAQKQQQLINQMEAVKKRFEEQMKNTERNDYSESLKEKQEAVKEQLDNLLDKELAEELAKLQELIQKMNKEDAFQQLQQMEQQNKLFNMDMERIQELMKQLELQMKMEDLAQQLSRLAEQEGDLNEQTEQGSKPNQQLAQEQDALKKSLESLLEKNMKELSQLDEKQQQTENLEATEEKGKEAGEEMDNSSQQLQQGQKQKASQAQQKAQKKLQEMSASMMQMAQSGNLQQIELDIKATRQLLTNLIRLSFDQEKLMNLVKITPGSSPVYLSNAQEQNRLSSNAKMIKDSLFVLSKRVFQIAPTINKETTELERNMQQTVTALGNRRMPEAVTRQQFAMTNANNLALLLNELLENLLQEQAQAMGQPSPGSGKPQQGQGGAGQMMKDIITGQQQLGEGKLPGPSGKPGSEGKSSGSGGSGEAQKIAQMAKQQAALRRQIQQLSSLLNSKGWGGQAKELKAIQELMDKQETDMVNKRFTEELKKRQRDILTRLLQAEEAIRNQEQDDQRSAREGVDESRPMPAEFQQYLKEYQQMKDLYKTIPPTLKPFYQQMAEAYLKEVNARP